MCFRARVRERRYVSPLVRRTVNNVMYDADADLLCIIRGICIDATPIRDIPRSCNTIVASGEYLKSPRGVFSSWISAARITSRDEKFSLKDLMKKKFVNKWILIAISVNRKTRLCRESSYDIRISHRCVFSLSRLSFRRWLYAIRDLLELLAVFLGKKIPYATVR